MQEAKDLAELKGDELYNKYAMVNDQVKHCNDEGLEKMYLNNVWNANLSVTGASGMPPVEIAGNAVRPKTSLRLSMRLAPNMDSMVAVDKMVDLLTTDVPYNAEVTILKKFGGNGWCMEELEEGFSKSVKDAGALYFDGRETRSYGMGGSIPFLSELGKMYPGT